MGERNEQKPTGFDFGNSPTHILEANFEGKTIVHTTSSGTQGIAAAVQADEIITGSFVNANAIIQYIKRKNRVSTECVDKLKKNSVNRIQLCPLTTSLLAR